MKRVLSTGDIDAASLLLGDNTDNGGPLTQPKGRRKKQRKVNAVTNNTSDDTGALQSGQSTQSTQSTECIAPAPTEISLLHDKIDVLLCTVQSQHETIKALSEKLNLVLSS